MYKDALSVAGDKILALEKYNYYIPLFSEKTDEAILNKIKTLDFTVLPSFEQKNSFDRVNNSNTNSVELNTLINKLIMLAKYINEKQNNN